MDRRRRQRTAPPAKSNNLTAGPVLLDWPRPFLRDQGRKGKWATRREKNTTPVIRPALSGSMTITWDGLSGVDWLPKPVPVG